MQSETTHYFAGDITCLTAVLNKLRRYCCLDDKTRGLLSSSGTNTSPLALRSLLRKQNRRVSGTVVCARTREHVRNERNLDHLRGIGGSGTEAEDDGDGCSTKSGTTSCAAAAAPLKTLLDGGSGGCFGFWRGGGGDSWLGGNLR